MVTSVDPEPEPERLEAADAVLGDEPVLLGDRMEIGSNAAYLDHRIRAAQGVPKLLFQVLSEARHAADLICLDPSHDEPTRMEAG